MQGKFDRIEEIVDEMLNTPPVKRDGLPAHVWAMQLQDQLQHARASLAEIRSVVRSKYDPMEQWGDDAQCCGCMQHVSNDLIERGLCQRCRS